MSLSDDLKAMSDAERGDKSAPAGVDMTLKDYDLQIGIPVQWSDAIRREQLVGEKIANEAKRIELDKAKGKLLTEKQVAARDEKVSATCLAKVAEAQNLLEGVKVSPEDQKVFLANFKKWRTSFAEALGCK